MRRSSSGRAKPATPPPAKRPSSRATRDVRLLALTHISSRYPGGEAREEARPVFAATEAPRDFDSIEIPFAEKGPATLIRWSDSPARNPA